MIHPDVIPGRAKREPGIHRAADDAEKWIPGSRQKARPGMTAGGEAESLRPAQQPMMEYYCCFARRRNSLSARPKLPKLFNPIATVHGVVFAVFVWRRG
ncbi:hypothetical protein [Bradyrhizobium sp. CCBAU 25338]|uniref:hypothetical protein n=1 Tax=Bradyrhizobium sp. CCBAU 25338 TaxID=1641877 RepID=UPI002303B3EA|nr:hypothetical protein [Bradyrhizobium sp. CCBAU 25338]